MQAWDQVKVKVAGPFEGRAGVVLRFDVEKKVNTVKLDQIEGEAAAPEAQLYTDDELTRLN